MSRGPEQLRLTPDERADLVAYIDGELPEVVARAVETKLTYSATARREVEMLKKTWELKDDKHRKAHKLIYETWPAAQTAGQMKPLLPQLREAFEACQAVGDWLRLRKLYRVNLSQQASRLTKEFAALKQDSEDDRETLKTIDTVTKELKTLDDEIDKFVREAVAAKS